MPDELGVGVELGVGEVGDVGLGEFSDVSVLPLPESWVSRGAVGWGEALGEGLGGGELASPVRVPSGAASLSFGSAASDRCTESPKLELAQLVRGKSNTTRRMHDDE
jgi:hypothetical protein